MVGGATWPLNSRVGRVGHALSWIAACSQVSFCGKTMRLMSCSLEWTCCILFSLLADIAHKILKALMNELKPPEAVESK